MANPNKFQQPAAPRRYDDMNFSAEPEPISGPPRAATIAAPRVQSSAPASTVSGGLNKAPAAFDRNMRDDEGGKPDRQQKKPQVNLDHISHTLGLGMHETRAIFYWCKDGAGYNRQFSRRYWDEDVLVDLFSSEGPDMRDEIEAKREAILEHNEEAKLQVGIVRQAAEKRAERRMAAAKALGKNVKLEDYVEEEFQLGMSMLRREGGVPFGYAPILNNLKDIDAAALKAGAVMELPEPEEDTWRPNGLGTRWSKHE